MTAHDAWPTLDELERQEAEVVLPELTEKVAYDLGRSSLYMGRCAATRADSTRGNLPDELVYP